MPAMVGSFLILFLATYELMTASKSSHWKLFGGSSLVCGVGGLALNLWLERHLSLLYWDNLIDGGFADGYYIVILSQIFVMVGSLVLVFRKSRKEKAKSVSAQEQKSTANTSKSKTPQKQTTTSSESERVPSSLPIWMLLFWIPLPWFASKLYTVSHPPNVIRPSEIIVPQGFNLSIYAQGVPDARSLALSDRLFIYYWFLFFFFFFVFFLCF
jgi:hypothetical protein